MIPKNAKKLTVVIKQINLLESSLDVKLFERTHRGLILTEVGKSLYQDTKYIIQYCRALSYRKEAYEKEKSASQWDGIYDSIAENGMRINFPISAKNIENIINDIDIFADNVICYTVD